MSATGESQLFLPVPISEPLPPDVPIPGVQGGGVLVPFTPKAGTATVNRTHYRLDFPVSQGNLLTLRRIHVRLPILITELKLESIVVTETKKKTFQTEAERHEFIEGKEGLEFASAAITPINYASRFEEIVTAVTTEAEGKFNIVYKTEKTTKRSVLPVEVTLVVRLFGPEGEMWAQSFDVTVHFAAGALSGAVGVGLVDAYADLTNAITLYRESIYSVQLELLLPTTVTTAPRIGLELVAPGEVANKEGEGGVTFFYDIEAVAVGK